MEKSELKNLVRRAGVSDQANSVADEQVAHRQILYLFASGFLVLFVGMGLFPILPLYAARFGASRTFIGIFFALMYAANAAGPAVVGWLGERISGRRLFILAGVLGVPGLIALGYVTALWQLVVVAAALWFFGGLIMALVSIFTGFYTNSHNRGKAFSLMALTVPLGTLAGATSVGQLVSRYEYRVMFAVLGAVWVALPALGLFLLKEKRAAKNPPPKSTTGADRFNLILSRGFVLLMVVSLLSSAAVNMGRLGSPLSMQALAFSPAAIASAATVSGLVTIPITFLIGVLADRLGRRRFLSVSYLLAAGGVLTLSFARELWQFWVASILLLVAFGVGRALSSALATDILSEAELARGLAWVNTANSSASIVSFALIGFLIDRFNPPAVFVAIAVLPVAGIFLLNRSSAGRQPAGALPAIAVEAARPPKPKPEELVWPVEGCM